MSDTIIMLQKAADAAAVADIVKKTIKEVYPHYYPAGAVQFFLDFHSIEHITAAMDTDEIYMLTANDTVVGTGSIHGNEITRLFILPEYQRKGYGRRMMDMLEEKVYALHHTVHMSASFPAENMYLKRGYQIVSYEKIKTENGDFLCYHTMERKRLNPWEEVNLTDYEAHMTLPEVYQIQTLS